jgi:hypothetical protein
VIGAGCAGLLYRFVWNRGNAEQPAASNTSAIAAAS